ncbi:MAG: hypothetical protein ACLQMO_00335 [Acidobacteriaceae bacterium]
MLDGCFQILLEKLKINIKTVTVADGGGNLDNQAIINGNGGAGYARISKIGQGEKVKQVKAMCKPGLNQISTAQSPQSPQG